MPHERFSLIEIFAQVLTRLVEFVADLLLMIINWLWNSWPVFIKHCQKICGELRQAANSVSGVSTGWMCMVIGTGCCLVNMAVSPVRMRIVPFVRSLFQSTDKFVSGLEAEAIRESIDMAFVELYLTVRVLSRVVRAWVITLSDGLVFGVCSVWSGYMEFSRWMVRSVKVNINFFYISTLIPFTHFFSDPPEKRRFDGPRAFANQVRRDPEVFFGRGITRDFLP